MTATLTPLAPASPALSLVLARWGALVHALYAAQNAAADLADALDADGAPEGRLDPVTSTTADDLRDAAAALDWDLGLKADVLASDCPQDVLDAVPLAWRLRERPAEAVDLGAPVQANDCPTRLDLAAALADEPLYVTRAVHVATR